LLWSSGGGRHFREGRWQSGDIGVDRNGKLRFGNQLPGARCYSLPGRVIAPGFIDILADNSTYPAATFPVFEKYKVGDGVTTALQMQGGSGDCGSYHAVMGAVPTGSTTGSRPSSWRSGPASGALRSAGNRWRGTSTKERWGSPTVVPRWT
jgi:hypothetical protein